MPYNTRHGGGRALRNTQSHPNSQSSPHSSEPDTDNPESSDEEQSADKSSGVENTATIKIKKKKKTPLPTLQNYHELGLEWGQVRADRILGRQPHIKPRVSKITLFEAQALQAQYNLDKTMLCIAEGISRPTLDAALYEGPLAREPNKYTNYQAYSLVSTTTPSDALMPPSTTTSTAPTDEDNTDQITTEEREQYLPLFHRLVNLKAVKRDFKHGRLCRHSGNAQILEKVGIEETKKIVKQLSLIHNKFGFQYHLLVAVWNPNTSMTRALYQDEFTSCEHWAEHARSEPHLLERFANQSTQAPKQTKKAKKTTNSTYQANLRKDLITRLNGLIEAHLPGGRQIKSDTHPQGPNPQVTLQTRNYRSGASLAILRLPDSQVTDEMLSKGCAAGKLPDAQVQIWIDDIVAGRYMIVKSTDPRLTTHLDSQEASGP
ncbi:uncharacterized protein MELLADRAFT_101494 [Melampsora larici-populina 98AG31]|uniref:Uncharacterized protein n=1 Tax=Melampsora larici-populina (strain 98AG31 / pathotype 3-4-7) TaxID=747676 RepID=F4R4Y1_MELLP|nr:uncharacterized protein MELLADRAFT_101494 [Melampsora larici-populina 98AG31]EGG12915.1 hypothetical protein MELLADRAFT_101494 [Melampsora larici-populina 98AG31]